MLCENARKMFRPGQPAHLAQADLDRNFLLFVNILHFQEEPVQLMIHSVVGKKWI